MYRLRACLFAGLLLTVAAGNVAAQQAWPGFRGADGAGVADVSLDVTTLAPEVVWRVRGGSGYSGVAVADGRVLTMAEDGDQFMLALPRLGRAVRAGAGVDREVALRLITHWSDEVRRLAPDGQ